MKKMRNRRNEIVWKLKIFNGAQSALENLKMSNLGFSLKNTLQPLFGLMWGNGRERHQKHAISISFIFLNLKVFRGR